MFIKRVVEQAVAIQREEGVENLTLTVFDMYTLLFNTYIKFYRRKCIEKSDEFDFVRDTCRSFIESLPEKQSSHKNSPIAKAFKTEIASPVLPSEAATDD